MTMSCHLDAVIANCIIYNLVITWCHLVQALLDDMVAIQIFDQCNDICVQSVNNGSCLQGFRLVARTCNNMSSNWELVLTCCGRFKNSIIFWIARVPCILREIVTISGATFSTIIILWSSPQYSTSFWHK